MYANKEVPFSILQQAIPVHVIPPVVMNMKVPNDLSKCNPMWFSPGGCLLGREEIRRIEFKKKAQYYCKH